VVRQGQTVLLVVQEGEVVLGLDFLVMGELGLSDKATMVVMLCSPMLPLEEEGLVWKERTAVMALVVMVVMGTHLVLVAPLLLMEQEVVELDLGVTGAVGVAPLVTGMAVLESDITPPVTQAPTELSSSAIVNI